MKKLISLPLMVVLLALVGCGTGNQGASSGPVTIKYGFWDKNQQPALQKIVDKFHQAHSNITVQIEVTPWTQYWTKLEAAATGGALPDVFWMNGPNFAKYASNGVLKSISGNIKSDNLSLSNYPRSLVDLYTLNGTNYALPKDFDTIGLFYNKSLFDAKSVKYPDASWDWQSVADAARKLTDASKGVWGIAAMETNQEGYYNTIFQAGGYVISPDRKHSGYDKPEAIAGLKFWTDLILKDHASPTQQQMSETDKDALFKAGKVAMVFGGSWLATDYAAADAIKGKWDVAALPKGAQRGVVIHGVGNTIAAKTAHPAEAWEFLKYLGSKDAADVLASTGTVIPAFNNTQDAWVKSQPGAHLQIFIDELVYSKPFPASKDSAKWQGDPETKILTKAWTGQTTVEAAAKEMATLMNAALAQE